MNPRPGRIGCEDALARLWQYLDDELPPAESEGLRRHLEVCRRCYPEYDFRRAYVEYMRRVGDGARAPREFRRRLFERLLAQETGNGSEA